MVELPKLPVYTGCKFDCTICESLGNCDLKKKFENLVLRRTNSTNKRLNIYGIIPVRPDRIRKLFLQSINNGLICSYCGEKMELFASREDFRMAISVDHIVPLSNGGTNSEENLVVCCTRCNLVKGTSTQDQFLFILNQFKEQQGHDKMIAWLNDSYKHALAYKMERMCIENGRTP
jgi:CRISPR/Cas system Type II protein with McrA/HNH and RuvC-like nuclease domain